MGRRTYFLLHIFFGGYGGAYLLKRSDLNEHETAIIRKWQKDCWFKRLTPEELELFLKFDNNIVFAEDLGVTAGPAKFISRCSYGLDFDDASINIDGPCEAIYINVC